VVVIVTNTKMPAPKLSITCSVDVQMHCSHLSKTKVMHRKTEGKVSVTPKSWLALNNTKTYYKYLRDICQASIWSVLPQASQQKSLDSQKNSLDLKKFKLLDRHF